MIKTINKKGTVYKLRADEAREICSAGDHSKECFWLQGLLCNKGLLKFKSKKDPEQPKGEWPGCPWHKEI